MDGDPATYERLLRDAYDRGVADGRAAAALGLPEPGHPPPGLPLNGARWYAAGYRAGLADQASRAGVPRPRSVEPRPARQLPGLEGV